MKILFSDNSLWGLLNFRLKIIEHFISLGHEVVLVAPQDELSDLKQIPPCVKYIPIKISRTGTNMVEDLRYYRHLYIIYKSERPDYIFHYTIKPNIYGTMAAKALKIRSSAIIAGLGLVYNQGGIGNMIARMMYKYAMRFPEYVFVLNRENRDVLLARKVVNPSKILWLEGGEGVDLEKFNILPFPNNPIPVFLMICRVHYVKGYTEYVETARALHGKAIFRLMGPIDLHHPSGVKRETVEADVVNNTIEYIGYSPDVQSQISSADCVVLPSFYEGLSRVLMEALAQGRPIITTDISGCRETVDNQINGFLVPPKDSLALIDACTQFIKLSAEQKVEMALKSRQKAINQFDINSILKIYTNIVAGKSLL